MKRSLGSPGGKQIKSLGDLTAWLDQHKEDNDWMGLIFATYIIDLSGNFVIAGRNFEHVACASRKKVLSAGEVAFDPGSCAIEEITNLSTGYCPEPESWSAVKNALEKAGLEHPGEFTIVYNFRRCEKCKQRNVIKDGLFECQVCGAELPEHWNFKD